MSQDMCDPEASNRLVGNGPTWANVRALTLVPYVNHKIKSYKILNSLITTALKLENCEHKFSIGKEND